MFFKIKYSPITVLNSRKDFDTARREYFLAKKLISKKKFTRTLTLINKCTKYLRRNLQSIKYNDNKSTLIKYNNRYINN